MHFSIPDTQETKDANGSIFTSYNIYVNGVFHCSVRYRQLHQFHEELKKEFGASALPAFPPKKILPLSPSQVEERRTLLERYIQLASQDVQISNSDQFNGFLSMAQQETQKQEPENVSLAAYLMNGHKITVNIVSTNQTEEILEAVASQIEIPDEYVYYFGLYLVRKEEGGDNSIVRKLQDFESPYISLKAANKEGVHRIVLRKSYWDSSFDDDLLENKITMNLLYVQAVSDIERQWVLATKDQLKHLTTLQERGSKRDYVRLARTLKYYGYIQFRPCVTDYPNPNSRVLVAAGNKELNFRVQVQDQIKEGSFKITRMRCWRITTTYPEGSGDSSSSSSPNLELSFEYLMARDTLKWITITSSQAMLMSMCLQNMVDELIMKKQGKKFKKPQDHTKSPQTIGVNGETTHYGDNTHFKRQSRESQVDSKAVHNDDQSAINKAMGSVKKISDKFSKSSKAENSITQNDAFEQIGDDDL
ncbi:sorting nexin-17-like isoform X2 [Gigantopelta aegis]|uniref:sorting nexin-17-like isoform X2 n=1 Tax=Gigantopelta aegis TaxID=1735272 RepID=UPI001B88AC6A|nr:sorting nexin-17-like isoform X2 [Gigantopelta aegis]